MPILLFAAKEKAEPWPGRDCVPLNRVDALTAYSTGGRIGAEEIDLPSILDSDPFRHVKLLAMAHRRRRCSRMVFFSLCVVVCKRTLVASSNSHVSHDSEASSWRTI